MAKSRTSDPRRLDVAAFAAIGGELAGDWPLAGFLRLALATVPAADAADTRASVAWHAKGRRAPLAGAGMQPVLELAAKTEVTLECQRCLQPMCRAVEVRRRFFFVDGEDAAAQLDAESDDDVLALVPALDLHDLAEDELILALPLVPRHDICPDPLVLPDDGGEDEREASPFAALAALRRGPLQS